MNPRNSITASAPRKPHHKRSPTQQDNEAFVFGSREGKESFFFFFPGGLKPLQVIQVRAFPELEMMGFPVGYSELLLLHTLFLLGFVRRLISWVFDAVGLGDLLDSDVPWPDPPAHRPEFRSVSAMLIQEVLPAVRYEELEEEGQHLGDSCAVCLNEFEAAEEVRRLSNCRHVFHRSCLDRWLEHDQRTCPLCRTPLIPEEMEDSFSDRLWAAAGVPDSFYDYSSSSSPSPPLTPTLLLHHQLFSS